MAVINNPIPNMTIDELRNVYKSRKANGVEVSNWKNFIKKYMPINKQKFDIL